MTRKISTRERVLRALRRGPVRPEDFLAPACDGGKSTTRVAARVRELRKAGYKIDTARQDNRCAIYTLISEPDLARNVESPGRPTDAPPPSVGGQLFATPEANEPRPHYVEEAEAA